MGFELPHYPSKAEVGVLDPEIAGEGQRVLLSDGTNVEWTPPPVNPVIPDHSQIKQIRHYFGRRAHAVYPAWLYHPTAEPRLVRNGEEAKVLGCFYREATEQERGRYGVKALWDYEDGCEWRSSPWHDPKLDLSKMPTGKTYIPPNQSPAATSSALVESLVPTVAAAVAKALNSNGPSAPAHIDQKDWQEFLAFQAFQKSRETVAEVVAEQERPSAGSALSDAHSALTSAISAEDEKRLWEDEAERKGIKIDRRWSLERLKTEVEKAA